MYLRRKIAITSIGFILLSVILTFVLAITSDYKYNVVTLNGPVEQRNQLQTDLSIEDNYFLLTPKLFLSYKMKNMEYIESVQIDRVLPNGVTIDYKIANPLFCDDETIYYVEQSLTKDVHNASLCVTTPTINNYGEFEDYIEFANAYSLLNIEFRYNLQDVESIDNYFKFTMIDGLVIDVYLSEFDNLNRYDEYIASNQYLDLRPKYS